MNEAEDLGFGNLSRQTKNASDPPKRAVGSPLPMGNGGRTVRPDLDDAQRFSSVPPPGRALSCSPEPEAAAPPELDASASQSALGLRRALGMLRMAAPLVRKVLPLLDGHIASSVASLLAQQPLAQRMEQSAQSVDLVPIEDGLIALETQQHDLRNQLVEQNTTLKRVEDQLEMVREATDRNTLEQQELLEDLKAVGNKAKLIAFAALALLAIAIALNLVLFLHLRRVLP